MAGSRFLVRPCEVAGYSPAHHAGTVNQRLVCQANVGALQMEWVLGTIAPGGGALPHAHPGVEQACYLLEGTAEVQVGDEVFDMVAGEVCFFPQDSMHVLRVTSEQPARLLVVYVPPYGEDAARVRRPVHPVPAGTK